MTPSGNGAAIRSTKSSSPDVPDTSCAVEDLGRDPFDVGSLLAHRAGVNRPFATRRTGPCFGGSSMTTISDGGITTPARNSVMPLALENRCGCFAISKMSACLVIAQNGS